MIEYVVDLCPPLSPVTVFQDRHLFFQKTTFKLRNGRITIMFVAFKGDAIIMRLYGTARCLPRHSLEVKDETGLLQKFGAEFVQHSAFRAVIVVDVHRIQSSCGYSIPFYDYLGERNVLKEHFGKQTEDQVNEYRIFKNSFSIDQFLGEKKDPAKMTGGSLQKGERIKHE